MTGMYPLPPRTEPLDYTGPDYVEIGDGDLSLTWTCWDAATLEFGPDYPCARCRQLEKDGLA